jgi:hypothetical protein
MHMKLHYNNSLAIVQFSNSYNYITLKILILMVLGEIMITYMHVAGSTDSVSRWICHQ